MITAISSVKQNPSKVTNLKHVNQVSFTGSSIKILKNEGKFSSLAEKVTDSVSSVIRKILGKVELPVSEKPLTANATIIHFGPDGLPIEIPAPEMHTTVTKILDGSNILKPDAVDLAAGAADALSTKAALIESLSGTSHAFDIVTGGLDAVATKAGIIDAVATGTDVLAAKTDAIDTVHKIINVVVEAIDKLPL